MIVGNYIVEFCRYCSKPVRINKWLFGSLHFCAPKEFRDYIDGHCRKRKCEYMKIYKRKNRRKSIVGDAPAL